MKGDDDEDEDSGAIGVARYPCMPSLVALQQMRNRLQLAHLGRKLMKWTALATGKELRRLAIQLNAASKTFHDDCKNAFILLARCRYCFPAMNHFVLESVPHHPRTAHVKLTTTIRNVTAVKCIIYNVVKQNRDPYEILMLARGGEQCLEAREAWFQLLVSMINWLQLRTCYEVAETAHLSATKKKFLFGRIKIPEIRGTILCIEEGLADENRDNLARLRLIRNRKLALRKRQEELKKIKDEEDRIKYLAEIEAQKKLDELNKLKDLAFAKKKKFAECNLKKDLEALIQKLKDAQVVFSNDRVNKEGCCYERSLAADGSTITCCERELNMLRLRPSCSDMAIFNTASAQAIIDTIPPEAMMMTAEATDGQVSDSGKVKGDGRPAVHLNIRSVTASKHTSRTAQLSKSTLGIAGNKLSGLLLPTGDRASREPKSSVSLNLDGIPSHRSVRLSNSKSVSKLTESAATDGILTNNNQMTGKDDVVKDDALGVPSRKSVTLAEECCQLHAKQICFFYNFAEINKLLSKAMIEAGEILEQNNSKNDLREFYEKCQRTKAEFVRVCSDEQDPIIILKKLQETFLNLKWDCEQMIRAGQTSSSSLSEEKLLNKCEKIAELIKQMFKGALIDRAEIVDSAIDTVFNTIKAQKDIGTLTEKNGLHTFMRAGFITKNKLHDFISYGKSVDIVEDSEREKLLKYISCYKKAAIDFKDSLGPCPPSPQESLENMFIQMAQDICGDNLKESTPVEEKLADVDSSCKKESCSKSSRSEIDSGVDAEMVTSKAGASENVPTLRKIPISKSEGGFIEQKEKKIMESETFENQPIQKQKKEELKTQQQERGKTEQPKKEEPKFGEQNPEEKHTEALAKQRSRVAKKNLTIEDLIKIVKEYAKDGLINESVEGLINSLSTTQSLIKFEEQKKRLFQYSEISGICDDPCECAKETEVNSENSSNFIYKDTPYCPCKVHSIIGSSGSTNIDFLGSTSRQGNPTVNMPLSKIAEQNSVRSKPSVQTEDSNGGCNKCFNSRNGKKSNKCLNSVQLRQTILSDTRDEEKASNSLQIQSSQFEDKEDKDEEKKSSHHAMYCTVDNTLKIENLPKEWFDAVSSLSDYKLASEIRSIIGQNDSFRSALSHVLEADELNEQNIETSVHEVDYEAQNFDIGTTRRDPKNKMSKNPRGANSFDESSSDESSMKTQSRPSPRLSFRDQSNEDRNCATSKSVGGSASVSNGETSVKASGHMDVRFHEANSDIDFMTQSDENVSVKTIPSKSTNTSTGENNFVDFSSSNLGGHCETRQAKITPEGITYSDRIKNNGADYLETVHSTTCNASFCEEDGEYKIDSLAMTSNIDLLTSVRTKEVDEKSDESKGSTKSSKKSLKSRIWQSINSIMKPDSASSRASYNKTYNLKNQGEKDYFEDFGEKSQSTLKDNAIEDDIRSIKTASLNSDTSVATLRNSPDQSIQSVIGRKHDGKSISHKSNTSYYRTREFEIKEENLDDCAAANSFQSVTFIIKPDDEQNRNLSTTDDAEPSRINTQDTDSDQNHPIAENYDATSHTTIIERREREDNDFTSLSFHSFSNEDVYRHPNRQAFDIRRSPQSCFIGRSMNSSRRSYFPNGVRLTQSERRLGNAMSTPRFTRSVSLCDMSRSYYRSLLMIRRNSENR